MTANAIRLGAQIAARVGKLESYGWKVEKGNSRQDWVYRITPPTYPEHPRVQIHSTPSDRNWEDSVWRDLNNAGFDKDWERYETDRETQRQATLTAQKRQEKAAIDKANREAKARAKAAGFKEVDVVDEKWLRTPRPAPETKTVIMTPEVAQALLDKDTGINTHNRPRRQSRVEYLIECILRDEWACTHQGGAVDANGVLQDGQHRLAAISAAGKPVEMQWTVGADPRNFTKIDTGATRTSRDVADIAKEANPATLSAAAKILIQVDRWGPDTHLRYRGTRISNDAFDTARLEYGDDLRAAVALAHKIRAEIKMNVSGLAAAIYLISTRLPAGDERVAKFFEDIAMGTNLDDTDPVRLLRRLFIRADKPYTSYETLAYIIKAWNFRATGKRKQQLVWRAAVEPFPATVFLPPPIGTKPVDDVDELIAA